MTDLDACGAATGTGDRSRPRAVLPALCITQITSWGIVYYAFPVLNPAITADTGWPTGATTAAFSTALLISAFAGIRVGRIIDRRGPRTVMTTGSTLAVASLLTVAAAPNLPVGAGHGYAASSPVSWACLSAIRAPTTPLSSVDQNGCVDTSMLSRSSSAWYRATSAAYSCEYPGLSGFPDR